MTVPGKVNKNSANASTLRHKGQRSIMNQIAAEEAKQGQ